MAEGNDSSSDDRIVFPDEFEEIKAQEEILIPENIQVTESRNKKIDCNVEDEKRNVTPPTLKNRNIIDAPSRCPEGYRADPTGKCRRIWH